MATKQPIPIRFTESFKGEKIVALLTLGLGILTSILVARNAATQREYYKKKLDGENGK